MTNQTLEQQSVTDEELMTAAGGYGSHRVAHKPFVGALQNLQVNDQAERDGSTKLQSLHSVATMG